LSNAEAGNGAKLPIFGVLAGDMAMANFKSICVIAPVALMLACPASAESLFVSALYPASYREASQPESISVERFDGRDGRALGYEIERQLADVRIDGQGWFDMISRDSGRQADARLSGTVNAGVDEQPVRETRKECVERDDVKKCLREEEVQMRCTRRIINVTSSVRLASVREGRILYSVEKPKREDVTFCPDRQANETADEVVNRMIKDIARSVRRDIAPEYRMDKIKVMEDRKGMPKPVATQFKTAIKYTKNSPEAACGLFKEVDMQYPNYGPILYDRGVCAEQAGRLDEAFKLYEMAQTLMPSERLVSNALSRIAARQEAESDWADRRTRRSR
jgi:hypothetical protein